MTVEIETGIGADDVVKLRIPLYCGCCQQWKSWGCTKCGVVFASMEAALAHECVGCRVQGRA
jgi:hypothetical protein